MKSIEVCGFVEWVCSAILVVFFQISRYWLNFWFPLGDYVLKVIERLLNNRARNIFLEAIVTYKILVSLISRHS